MHGTTFPPQSPPSRTGEQRELAIHLGYAFGSDNARPRRILLARRTCPRGLLAARVHRNHTGLPDRLDVYHDWCRPRADAGRTDHGVSVTRAFDDLLTVTATITSILIAMFCRVLASLGCAAAARWSRRRLRLPWCLPTPSGRRAHPRVGGRSVLPASRGSSVLVGPGTASRRPHGRQRVRRHRRPPAVARPIPPHPYARSRSQHRR